MKIRVETQVLQNAVQIAAGIIPARSAIAMLQNVKISVEKGKAHVQATDLEIGLTYRFPLIEVQEEGAVSLPGTRLLQVLREVNDESVGLESQGFHCYIDIDAGRFRVVGADPDEYPSVPEEIQETESRIIHASLFLEMVRKTAFATGAEDPRFALNGVLLIGRGDTLEMVATDGKRLAHNTLSAAGDVGEFRAIVPAKTLRVLGRMTDAETEQITFKVTENKALFKTNRGTLFSRLLEGTFPNYQAVLPSKAHDKLVRLQREKLMHILRQAAAMTDERSRAVKMKFESQNLYLFSQSQDVGESQLKMTVEFSDTPFEIAFNPAYITEALSLIDDEILTLQFRDRNSAGIIRSEKNGHVFTYIVMPIVCD